MSESALLRQILIRASAIGLRLFRNQVGKYQLPDGRWITSGLCVGSSDLIGWTPVTITPDMIGRTLAVFTAIETKAPNRSATDKQAVFLAAVVAAGGIGIIATSVADVEWIAKEVASNGKQHPLGHVAPTTANER